MSDPPPPPERPARGKRRRARKSGTRISVSLSKVAHARLQHRAEARGMTVSAVAAEAIQSELDRPQSEAPPEESE